MQPTGLMHPTDGNPVPPDTCYTFNMTGGSSAQASDWVSTAGVAVANAALAQVGFARISGMSTAGASLAFNVNMQSTGAVVGPSSGTSINSSNGVSVPVIGQRQFQIKGDSTGFSVASLIPGYIQVEVWRK